MNRKRIGDLLLEKGLITTRQLDDSLQIQKTTGRKIGDILVENGVITEDQLIATMAERLKIPNLVLESIVIDPMVISLVPVEVARRYTLVPVFKIGRNLTVAMADPLNIIAIEEIKYITKLEIKRVISSPSAIKSAIDQYYSVADNLSNVIGSLSAGDDSTGAENASEGISQADNEAPVVKLVNLIIDQAIKARASDIHIEPDSNQLRVRYRINGVMKEEASPPKNLQAEIISRIKVASNMDVSEKRLPQDGRLSIRSDNIEVDLRISTLPTIHGEKIVIRILDKRILNVGLGQLGFFENQLKAIQELISMKEGLFLTTGPTSSGKTTTLYSILQEISSIEKNIITIEDPVEYSLPLINQVQINEKAGLNFVSTLRSILRQNPDVIMLGEIRDSETAMMAIRSALTGHLVLSTLHTNDAPGAIFRLLDMGIENYLVASSLKGVVAQRLLRTNCPDCSENYEPSEVQIRLAGLDNISGIKFMKGTGCNRCRMTGFSGQTGIYEIITVDDIMAEMIINNAGNVKLKNHAIQKGYRPLYEAGLEKVKDGKVCLEEFLRVITISEFREMAYNRNRESVNV